MFSATLRLVNSDCSWWTMPTLLAVASSALQNRVARSLTSIVPPSG
jgi:hypothetical protein